MKRDKSVKELSLKLAQSQTLSQEKQSEVIVISNFRTKKISPLVWREGIKKIWEVDPFLF